MNMIVYALLFVLLIGSIFLLLFSFGILIKILIKESFGKTTKEKEQKSVFQSNEYFELNHYKPSNGEVLEADGIIFCNRAYGSHCLKCKYSLAKEKNGKKILYGCLAPDLDGIQMVGLRVDKNENA